MVVKSCLARIKEVEESIYRELNRGPKICFDAEYFGLWLELPKENLKRLEEDFGIANDGDLVGRECIINYETEDFKFFSEKDVRSIVPCTEYPEDEFAGTTYMARAVLEETGVFNEKELELIVNNCLSETAKRDIKLICHEPKFLSLFKQKYGLEDASTKNKQMWWYGFFSGYEEIDKDLRVTGKEEELGWRRVYAARMYVGMNELGCSDFSE